MTNILAGKKLLCFDLFHTLICSRTDGTKTRMTSDILGIPESIWTDLVFDSSEARLRGEVHDKYEIIRNLAHQYDPTISEALIQEAADHREMKFNMTLAQPNPGKETILRELKKRGFATCLVSNADSIEVAAWNQCTLAKYFDQTVFSYQIGHMKPEREIYEYALNLFPYSTSQTAFIGDGGNHELRGAQAMGFTTIMTTEIIKTTWPEKIDARSIDADFIIDDLSQLLNPA